MKDKMEVMRSRRQDHTQPLRRQGVGRSAAENRLCQMRRQLRMMALHDARHWRRAVRWALLGGAMMALVGLAAGNFTWGAGLLVGMATLITLAASLMTSVEFDVDGALAYWQIDAPQEDRRIRQAPSSQPRPTKCNRRG